MNLRNQVEWALHCCSVLAGLGPGEMLSTKTLAEFHGVPKEYLSKALQALAQAELITGTLGPTGGYRLARPPNQISFLDIVEAVEGPTSTFNCMEIRKNNPCLKTLKVKSSPICTVAKVMYRADQAWRRELKSVTLEVLKNDLAKEVGSEILERSAEWLRSQRGN